MHETKKIQHCEFWASTSDGQILCGTVFLDGETITYTVCNGYETLMRNVVKDHVIVDGCRRCFPKDEPEKWFANLPREYDGTYLRAGFVDSKNGA